MYVSPLVTSDSLQSHGLLCPWDSLGKNTGMGSPSLLQEIFPTQGSNLGLLNYRQFLYYLSYQGSLNSAWTVSFNPHNSPIERSKVKVAQSCLTLCDPMD